MEVIELSSGSDDSDEEMSNEYEDMSLATTKSARIEVISLGSEEEEEEEMSVSSPVRGNLSAAFGHPDDDDDIVFVTSSRKLLPPGEDILFDSPLQQEKGRPCRLSAADIAVRRREADALTEKYGAEAAGWGVKTVLMENAEVVESVALSVIPKPRSPGVVVCVYAGPDARQTLPLVRAQFSTFPPIRVRIAFSNVSNAAVVSISCPWLVKRFTKRLTGEMQKIYDRSKGSLTETVQWLERNGIPFLDICQGQEMCYVTPGVNFKNPSCVMFDDPESVLGFYERTERKLQTLQGSALMNLAAFDCDICFDHKPAMSAVVFPGCKHFFCRDCAAQDLTLKVKDGQIKDLTCLGNGCKSLAEEDMMKDLVDKPTFLRYCEMKSEDFVDGIDTIIRCPKKECSAPMDLGNFGDLRDIRCLTCQYWFCAACKAASHKGSSCLSDAQKKEIRVQWDAADEKGREDLKQRYGADNVRFAREDAVSLEWIGKNTKPCPTCATPIEKHSGCNKMICTAKGCGAYFCWICSQVLDKINPYVHFNAATGGSKCAGKLYQAYGPDGQLAAHQPAYPGQIPAHHIEAMQQQQQLAQQMANLHANLAQLGGVRRPALVNMVAPAVGPVVPVVARALGNHPHRLPANLAAVPVPVAARPAPRPAAAVAVRWPGPRPVLDGAAAELGIGARLRAMRLRNAAPPAAGGARGRGARGGD